MQDDCIYSEKQAKNHLKQQVFLIQYLEDVFWLGSYTQQQGHIWPHSSNSQQAIVNKRLNIDHLAPVWTN